MMNLANRITISRIILTPLFIMAIVYGKTAIALLIFTMAAISDGLDGFIARTLKQKTVLGTILDPLADKILLISAFICLAMAKNLPDHIRLPPYVPIVVISRDAIIVLGSIIIHVLKGDIKIEPSVWGKLTTFFQMMTIVSILIQFRYSQLIWSTAVLFTVISGIDYMLKGSRVLSENSPNIKRKV